MSNEQTSITTLPFILQITQKILNKGLILKAVF